MKPKKFGEYTPTESVTGNEEFLVKRWSEEDHKYVTVRVSLATIASTMIAQAVAGTLSGMPIPQKGDAGPGPTPQQIADAVASYWQTHPPADGMDATDEQVATAVAAYLALHPPAPGANATDNQIALAVMAYLQAFPPAKGDPGKDATTQQIATAVSTYLSANPPAAGQNATDAQVEAKVTEYLTANPVRNGADATPQQIANAVNAYLLAHPIKDGANATDAQVAAAVATYIAAHPPADGKNATDLQVSAAVAAYLAANPVQNGKSVELQVASGYIQSRQTGGQWINLVALAELAGKPKRVEIYTMTSNASGVATFTWSAFDTVPTVVGIVTWAAADQLVSCSPGSITKTGCTAATKRSRGTLILSLGPFETAPNTPTSVLVMG
jgi:hypothetical protein